MQPKKISEREGIILTKCDANKIMKLAEGFQKLQSRGEVYGWINNRKPKQIKWCDWEAYSWLERCDIIIANLKKEREQQKKELLKKQQELFNKLMKEAEEI